ncbi:hypothetical protein D1871_15600 [Nakamurella silvestris]|nr:hypothetical protein D1871_15600 [Nakamurella silvestris]
MDRWGGVAAVSDLTSRVEELYAARAGIWERAKHTACEALRDIAVAALASGGRTVDTKRISIDPGRVKDKSRFEQKLRRKVAGAEDLPDLAAYESEITDVVGVSVICKTRSDVELFVSSLKDSNGAGSLRIKDESDWREKVKPSGYRAYHALLDVSVPGASHETVVVEVQVKTMLEKSWGELTHETLYQTGVLRSDAFHDQVGRAMADMLDAVDRLADSLAQAFDRKTIGPADTDSGGVAAGDEAAREVAAESGISLALSATAHTHVETVDVVYSSQNYALATFGDRRGLIPASRIRSLLGVTELIDVDEYLQKGDRLTAEVVEDKNGLYLYPTVREELRQ